MIFTGNPDGRRAPGKNPDKWQWANVRPRAKQTGVPDMRNNMSGLQANPSSVCRSNLNLARFISWGIHGLNPRNQGQFRLS